MMDIREAFIRDCYVRFLERLESEESKVGTLIRGLKGSKGLGLRIFEIKAKLGKRS